MPVRVHDLTEMFEKIRLVKHERLFKNFPFF